MQKTIYVYQSHLCQIGGVETFLYNWCLNLKDYYDITILYGSGDAVQIERLSHLVKIEKYDSTKNYTCDIFLRNSVWGAVPNNIVSKDNRYLEMRHADYQWLQNRGVLKIQYTPFSKTNEVIGCAEHVSRKSNLVLHDNPTTIINILAPKKKIPKTYKFISCTRIDNEKGWERMLTMMDMMKKAGIKFQWDIYTNARKTCKYSEVTFHKPTFDIWEALVAADYCVLLSNAEGCPYTVQEALQYQIPCIVTDIEGCTELVTDGVNGYVVPLDMNFDIKKILTIPKCPPYDNHALETWLNYLGNSDYHPEEKIYLVKALSTYQQLKLKDQVLDRIPRPGETWYVDLARLNKLLGNNSRKKVFVKLVQEFYKKDLDADRNNI